MMNMKRMWTPLKHLAAVSVIVAGGLFLGVKLFWVPSRSVSTTTYTGIAAPDSGFTSPAHIEPVTVPAAIEAQPKGDLVPDSLPPFDAPLVDVLPELEARAHAGDRSASCRLAAEEQYCASLSRNTEEHDRWLAERERAFANPREGIDYDIPRKVFEQELEQREKTLNWQAMHCANVAAANPQAIIEEWRHAATLGSPAAMRNYASGAVFEWSHLLDSAAQLTHYKSEAAQMATTLAAWGDAPMNLALAGAYSPYASPGAARTLLGQTVQPNAAMALALYTRLHRTLAAVDPAESIRAASLSAQVELEIRHLEERMSEGERTQATNLVKALDLQWQPVGRGLDDTELYPGSSLPLRPRSACGPARPN